MSKKTKFRYKHFKSLGFACLVGGQRHQLQHWWLWRDLFRRKCLYTIIIFACLISDSSLCDVVLYIISMLQCIIGLKGYTPDGNTKMPFDEYIENQREVGTNVPTARSSQYETRESCRETFKFRANISWRSWDHWYQPHKEWSNYWSPIFHYRIISGKSGWIVSPSRHCSPQRASA